MTTLESKVMDAINDILDMFGYGADTIESETLINNASEYGLNTKQIRANLVTLEKKGIIELVKHNGIQCIIVK